MTQKKEMNDSTAKALIGLGKIIVEDRKEVKAEISKLTDAVTELTLSHVETRKDRENDSIRMERLEENQKDQGKEIKNISDTVLILDERVKNSKSKWDRVATIITTVSVAAIIAYLGIK